MTAGGCCGAPATEPAASRPSSTTTAPSLWGCWSCTPPPASAAGWTPRSGWGRARASGSAAAAGGGGWFAEAGGGGFFCAAADGERLIARHKELDDNPTPSGQSLMATVLLRLARLGGDERMEGEEGARHA